MLGAAATMAEQVAAVVAALVGTAVELVLAAMWAGMEATEALKEGRCSKRRCRASSRL